MRKWLTQYTPYIKVTFGTEQSFHNWRMTLIVRLSSHCDHLKGVGILFVENYRKVPIYDELKTVLKYIHKLTR